ncbi:MAG TPA: hypothetical protein IAC36_02980 [Candidatus Aphodomonas merdavium]|nr:hypothetical protein [Candidatus Aphodomonas merdavium]
MYFQRDYVLRMIEMMGEFARRLLDMAREEDARIELDQVSRRACGMPLAMLKKTDVQTLQTLLSEPQRYFSAQLLLLSCEIDARTSASEELAPTRAQALALLSTLEDPDYVPNACALARRTMEPLLDFLSPPELLCAAALFERGDDYAAAEDALYESGDRQARKAFYERLLRLDDAALLAGNLPREEILEAAAKL